MTTTPTTSLATPSQILDALAAEMHAARTLLAIRLTPCAQHRNATAALQLSADLLEDARAALAAETDGTAR